MRELNEFRVINETERRYIQESVSRKILEGLIKLGYFIYISLNNLTSERAFPTLYLISNNLTKLVKSIGSKNIINSAGLYFGFIKKGQFFLSLEGAEFLLSHDFFTENQFLYVSKKGEKSVLYGNRIVKQMITKLPHNIDRQSLLLVFNESNEFIALARSEIDNKMFEALKSKEVIAINLIDKGYYLRKKQ